MRAREQESDAPTQPHFIFHIHFAFSLSFFNLQFTIFHLFHFPQTFSICVLIEFTHFCAFFGHFSLGFKARSSSDPTLTHTYRRNTTERDRAQKAPLRSVNRINTSVPRRRRTPSERIEYDRAAPKLPSRSSWLSPNCALSLFLTCVATSFACERA